jgi:Tol biopolymer transport system component
MALSPGTRLGPYQISAQIGIGGMGEVYQATDTKLGRQVAIKVLPDLVARDAERLARFDREARTLASLNHPNIAAIYGLEDAGGSKALVMELVEGPTLADRIADGPMPLDEALPIARQIVEALDAAHDQGIVHRDLKPANIKVRADGTVKVLDFGLAKAMDPTGALSASQSMAPTITTPAITHAGLILGTAAYMSPEQAKGRPVDKRADIWAFGAVLYEMVSGTRLYEGESTTEVIASVIKDEPRWDRVPPQLQRLLRRCLEKDPQKRQRHIGDVMALVDDVPALTSAPASARPAVRQWPWMAAGVAAVAALLAVVALWVPWAGQEQAASIRFEIQPTAEATFINGGYPMVSPDGRWVVFPAMGTDRITRMWLRALDAVEVRPLAGTESGNALPPPVFWSPDSRSIAFSATPGPFSSGQLKRIDIAGGPATTIADVPGAVPGGTWNRDGTVIFASNGSSGLFRVSAAGGVPAPVTVEVPGEGDHRFVQFLPDGRRFLYMRTASDPTRQGTYVGSLDVAPEDQPLDPVLLSDRQAMYTPSLDSGPGRLVFLRETTLFAQPFDPDTATLSGEPVPLADQVGSFAPATAGLYSLSETGVLAYRVGPGGDQLRLTWRDPQGADLGTVGTPGSYQDVTLSPDGSHIAVTQFDRQGGDSNIWVRDLARGTSTKVTFGTGRNSNAVWSPDGNSIAFASNRQGRLDIYQKAADGSGEERLLLESDEDTIPTSWSRDGRFLLYQSEGLQTGSDLWVLPLQDPGSPFPFLRTEFIEQRGAFSPDGRWVAYSSNEAGTIEIYVRPFSAAQVGEAVAGGKWLISSNSGGFPKWRADGQELFYLSLGLQQMAVSVTSQGDAFQAGVPRALFDGALLTSFDVSADGQRFLYPELEEGTGTDARSPFMVVTNWQAALTR